MFRKAIITIVVFLLVGLCVFGVGAVADPDVGAPQAIVPESACPVVGCASGECHGFDNVPRGRLLVYRMPRMGLADGPLPPSI